ncbi:putative FMO family protein, partial [Teratosphaeria destructans]
DLLQATLSRNRIRHAATEAQVASYGWSQREVAHMSTKSATAVIFESLRGTWRMRRSLNSVAAGFPSGTFEGQAILSPRKPSAHSVAAELLYAEEGELKTDNGFTLRANRKYIYRYNADEDKISAWFVKEDTKQNDGGEEVDYLFHDLEIAQGGKGEWSGWVGRGEHLCDLDMYWAYYEFRMPKVVEDGQAGMDVFGVRYKVKDIYINAPIETPKTTHQFAFLHAILPLCYNLTITFRQDHCKTVAQTTSRSSSISTLRAIIRRLGRSGEEESKSREPPVRTSVLDKLLSLDKGEQRLLGRRRWVQVFEACRQLRRLTLRVDGDPNWSGCTEIESQLVQARCALEEACLPTTFELRLDPIHAMGLVHLRCSSFGAFGSPLALHQSPPVWHKLKNLEVLLQNPFVQDRLSGTQARQFQQLMYSYFRGFASTLQRLTFVYLGGEGPSPLTLHLQPELSYKAPLKWCELTELRLGNITFPHRTLGYLASMCPKLEAVKLLRAQYRYSVADIPEDEDMWLNVRVTQNSLVGRRVSSVYSEPDLDAAWQAEKCRLC